MLVPPNTPTRPRLLGRGVAGLLQRLPAHLEEQPLLRVGERRLRGLMPKKAASKPRTSSSTGRAGT